MNVHTGVNTTDAERIRVLFVEDEFFIREWIAQSLSEQGFAVESATNAADALLHIARAPIDVLLTDINLPGGMDGKTLAGRMLQENPRLKVIYTSGYRAEGAGGDLPLEEGVNFLTKPFTATKLAETVRNCLDKT